jgi:hypothetical protein
LRPERRHHRCRNASPDIAGEPSWIRTSDLLIKSLADSGELTFAEGMNLLVGQNNSGKSAVLKSFTAGQINWPHRNLDRFREVDLIPSVRRFRIRVSGAELRDALLMTSGAIHFPTRNQINNVSPQFIISEYLQAPNLLGREHDCHGTSLSKGSPKIVLYRSIRQGEHQAFRSISRKTLILKKNLVSPAGFEPATY